VEHETHVSAFAGAGFDLPVDTGPCSASLFSNGGLSKAEKERFRKEDIRAVALRWGQIRRMVMLGIGLHAQPELKDCYIF